MNNINLIIDYNNFAMRSLFTCQFMDPDIKISNFQTQQECDVLVRKITMDICKVIRTFSPNRVIISCDAKHPWRKDLYKDIDGMEYKGTRDKDSNKNWDNIFQSIDELKDIFKTHGIIVSYIEHTEADDITTMWKEYFFDNNQDVILVSSDMDWVQLVGKKNNNVCLCYNPIANNKGRKRLFIDNDIKEWIETEDKPDIFFTNVNYTKKTIKNIQSVDPKISFEIIDPERILMNKIMAGDVSDNVPSFWHYYRNGKKQNVTELKAKHVFESLHINTVDDLIKSANNKMLKDSLEKEMKQDIDIDFKERIDRQRKLVELKSFLFPKDIVDKFNKSIDESLSSCDNTLQNVKMEDILNNTKFMNKIDYKSGKLNSIFDDINLLSKYSTDSKKLFE